MIVPDYGKIFALGKREVADILDDFVEVQEKVDGSQISFMVDLDGNLFVRSKNVQIDIDNPGPFEIAVRELKARAHRMQPGYVYRGEFLRAPRHNVLAYDRVPHGHVCLYDVQTQIGPRPSGFVADEAERLDLEAVTCLFAGLTDRQRINALLTFGSFLGGKMEGVVIKSRRRTGRWITDKGRRVWSPDEDPRHQLPLMAKLVSKQFKEVAQRPRTNVQADPVAAIGAKYATEARWQKALQHLADQGLLKGDMGDMPRLLGEVARDVKEEEEEAIKDALFKAFWKKIARRTGEGMADWYRRKVEGGLEDTGE